MTYKAKFGDRSIIYQKVRPLLDTSIQNDIDSYWNENNKCIYSCSNDQFSTKWYWRHMHFYALMGESSGPEFTIYAGGICGGFGYDITFNVDTLKYSLKYSLSNAEVYETFEWNDMIIKVDAIMEKHRDIAVYMKSKIE